MGLVEEAEFLTLPNLVSFFTLQVLILRAFTNKLHVCSSLTQSLFLKNFPAVMVLTARLLCSWAMQSLNPGTLSRELKFLDSTQVGSLPFFVGSNALLKLQTYSKGLFLLSPSFDFISLAGSILPTPLT